MSSYEPNAYWKQLLDASFDESGVGYPQLARALNRAMYNSFQRSVHHALRSAGVQTYGARVLDIGSGTGIWIDFWTRLGAQRVNGVDLTEASVQRLRDRWPNYDFAQGDIGDPGLHLPLDNDIVSAMSVLLHIVEEERFRAAFMNLARALKPGGVLVLVEPVVVHRWWGPPFGSAANSKARTLEEYRDALNAAGLQLQTLQAATVLMANVVDTRGQRAFKLLETYWNTLGRIVGQRELVGKTAVSILGPIDCLATRLAKGGPSAKVLIARRAG